MLAGVLDGNPAARLNKSLVRESRIATDAGAGFDAISRGPGLFLLEGTPSEGKSVAELEAALRAEVEKIKQDGVAEEELVRVRSQLVASRVFQQDSIFYQAMQIGQLEATGFSHRVKDVRLKKLQEVTPEQVREVAKKYLVDDRLTVAVLDPQPLEEKKPVMKKMGGRHGG
jgi:zinc protease